MRGALVFLSFVTVATFAGFRNLNAADLNFYRDLYAETLNSLDSMRAESGLINDGVRLKTFDGRECFAADFLTATSPTNVALDLLAQLGALHHPKYRDRAAVSVRKILNAVDRLERHKATGLFFSWYSTRDRHVEVRDVSSVDNIHLALALWTASRLAPDAGLRKLAESNFRRMNFDVFYSPPFMGGNLHFRDGTWQLENYRYSHFGSEARSVYSIGQALRLFSSAADSRFAERTAVALTIETTLWKGSSGAGTLALLKTWQGGAFQLLLPELLIDERRYSARLLETFSNYFLFIRARGIESGFSFPAAFSACEFRASDEKLPANVPMYDGNVGSPELVSGLNHDFESPKWHDLWDMVVSPHAVLLAAVTDPSGAIDGIRNMESLKSSWPGDRGIPLRCPGFGFADGVYVKGRFKGKIVPVQLSLDQGMSTLALEMILSPDGFTSSSRALFENPSARKSLRNFYSQIDKHWKAP